VTQDNCSATKQQSPHGMEPKGLLSRSQVPQWVPIFRQAN